ncbi:MAG: hypothetical protein Q9187_003183 [Circinaria calcarea]
MGREITRAPSEDSNFRAVERWLNFCDKNHNCRLEDLSPLPARVLDIGQPDGTADPFLSVNPNRRGRYVALSYCWGNGQKTITTRHTLEKFRIGIQTSTLSQSLQDAVMITRRLGLRYLWIDALCIIQKEDDLKDFLVESQKMAQYYGNAYLTLVAGSAADCQDGILAIRPQPARHCRLVYSRPGGLGDNRADPIHSFVYACLPVSSKVGPIEGRAWTLQEAILSPRLLVYGQEQISFTCQRRTIYEDGTSSPAQWKNQARHTKTPRLDVIAQRPNPALVKAEMLREWYNIVHQYTVRNMKDPNDKLTALVGIAERISNTLRCKYLFGLWEDDLIRGLLWRSGVLLGIKEFNSPLHRPDIKRAPSWSWACVDGPVRIQYLERQESIYCNPGNYKVKILGHSIPTASFDPIRMHCSFQLKLQGVLKSVRRSRADITQYRPKTMVNANKARVKEHVIFLEPADAPNGEIQNSTEMKVVGLGLPDILEEFPASLLCTRLISQEGLLLASIGGGMYRRIGVFWVEDEDWFSQYETEDFILI